MTTKFRQHQSTQQASQHLFFSMKNKTTIECRSRAEYLAAMLCEFDATNDKYEPFVFKMVNARSLNELETRPGFIIHRGNLREFVILSNQLASDAKLRDGVKRTLQQYESNPITLTVWRTVDLERNELANNIAFLYPHAAKPISLTECLAVRNFFDFVPDITICRLRTFLQIDKIIYQLLFYRGLRADLTSQPLDDATSVGI